MSGLGYMAEFLEKEGKRTLRLKTGKSHDDFIEVPDIIKVKVQDIGKTILLECIDKQKLGDFSDKLLRVRKHNPYDGKGVLLDGKKYKRKEGKKKVK